MAGVSRLHLPVRGDRFRLDRGQDAGTVNVVRVSDEFAVGRFEIKAEGGSLTIQSLCIDETRRGYGAGSEAARLLLQAAEAAGFAMVRAWAHPDLGLSAYFWGRMGLRPLHGPGPEGGIWYERSLKLQPVRH